MGQCVFVFSFCVIRFIQRLGGPRINLDFSEDDDLLKYDGIDDANILLNFTDFKYRIPKLPCNQTSEIPDIIAMIHSGPLHIEQRQAIRETWGRSNPKFRAYFILGSVLTKIVQTQIEREDAEHNDIIQGNFIDSYHNLTYKHTMVLKWASTNCPEAKYVIKLDDDVFPNIFKIFEYVSSDKTEKGDIIGQYFPDGKVLRRGKWRVEPSQFKDNVFLPYVHTYGVIYSMDYIRNVYRKSRKTRFFWIDDVFVNGLVGIQLNVKTANIKHLYLKIKNETECITNETSIQNMDFLFTNSDIMPNEMHILWNKTSFYQMNKEKIKQKTAA